MALFSHSVSSICEFALGSYPVTRRQIVKFSGMSNQDRFRCNLNLIARAKLFFIAG